MDVIIIDIMLLSKILMFCMVNMVVMNVLWVFWFVYFDMIVVDSE